MLYWLRSQWEQSNIISGLLAGMIWGAIVYLAIAGREAPPVLVAAGGMVVGYFFKSKKE